MFAPAAMRLSNCFLSSGNRTKRHLDKEPSRRIHLRQPTKAILHAAKRPAAREARRFQSIVQPREHAIHVRLQGARV